MLVERLFYITYFIFFVYVVWFMRIGPEESIIINLTPFRTIRLFLVALVHGYAPLPVIAANLLGNIILTIPLGMLLFRFVGRMPMFFLCVLAFYIPMHIESIQVFLHVVGYSTRTIDIDDVLLNGVGILIGYFGAIVYAKRQLRATGAPSN